MYNINQNIEKLCSHSVKQAYLIVDNFMLLFRMFNYLCVVCLYNTEAIHLQILPEPPVVERIGARPPSCYAHCAEPKVESSIPLASFSRAPGYICVIKIVY